MLQQQIVMVYLQRGDFDRDGNDEVKINNIIYEDGDSVTIDGITYTIIIDNGIITGINGDDFIVGSNNDDEISGLEGDDFIVGLNGDDNIT